MKIFNSCYNSIFKYVIFVSISFWRRKSIIHSLQIISTKSLLHVILVSRTHSGCSSKLSPNFLVAPMYNNIFLLCLLSSREILSSVPVGRYSLSVLPLFVLAGQYKSEHNKFASPRLASPRPASPRPASRESSPREEYPRECQGCS